MMIAFDSKKDVPVRLQQKGGWLEIERVCFPEKDGAKYRIFPYEVIPHGFMWARDYGYIWCDTYFRPEDEPPSQLLMRFLKRFGRPLRWRALLRHLVDSDRGGEPARKWKIDFYLFAAAVELLAVSPEQFGECLEKAKDEHEFKMFAQLIT